MKQTLQILFLSSLLMTPLAAIAEEDQPLKKKNPIPLDEILLLTEVLQRINTAYVEDVDDRELLHNAIRGLLLELDPHSDFLSPQDYEDLHESTTGEFGGIGIEVGMEDGLIKVITPLDGTPADEAGILSGDYIIEIDDHKIKGMSLSEAVELMRGEIGTSINLLVVRKNEEKPLEFKLLRDRIQVKSVRHRELDQGIYYLRISQFQTHTGTEVQEALEDILQKDLAGLVLDLRNNPGGILPGAVAVSNLFLNSGTIVSIKGRAAGTQEKHKADGEDMLNGTPVVVLVNDGSASAAEIVAGALQDNKRAIIMGTSTFGKGSVQTVLPLHANYALKLTTARYYTPGGKSIQAQGITPDIWVHPIQLSENQARMEAFKEADLEGHLENKQDKNNNNHEAIEQLALQDYQLYQAVNLLKSLQILNAK